MLNLCGVGLTRDDVFALEALAGALGANTSVEQVDLDANFFGAHEAQRRACCQSCPLHTPV